MGSKPQIQKAQRKPSKINAKILHLGISFSTSKEPKTENLEGSPRKTL